MALQFPVVLVLRQPLLVAVAVVTLTRSFG